MKINSEVDVASVSERVENSEIISQRGVILKHCTLPKEWQMEDTASARFQLKNRKDISYPTIIRLAIRLVLHGPDLPIRSPPDTLDNILDDLYQISHIRSDRDDGQQSGYTKFPCFLCEWDSRDRKQHNVKQTWPIRKDLIPGVKNVERES
ncbi:hypothetical protein TNCV_4503031 [Trichonephila clavipes]|nr:hypothetical protein TNCV_4503031 [Trichonephila clavipes]